MKPISFDSYKLLLARQLSILLVVQPGMIKSGKANSVALHIHSNLKIMVDNKHTIIPTGKGIHQTPWNDHALDSYGMPAMGGMKGWREDGGNGAIAHSITRLMD